MQTPADKVPISKKGNLCNPLDPKIHEWVEGGKFVSTLRVYEYKYKSSAYVLLMEDIHSGTLYRMFVSDFAQMFIACKGVSNGVVRGLWEFVKTTRRPSYGIRLLQQLRD